MVRAYGVGNILSVGCRRSVPSQSVKWKCHERYGHLPRTSGSIARQSRQLSNTKVELMNHCRTRAFDDRLVRKTSCVRRKGLSGIKNWGGGGGVKKQVTGIQAIGTGIKLGRWTDAHSVHLEWPLETLLSEKRRRRHIMMTVMTIQDSSCQGTKFAMTLCHGRQRSI